MEMTPNLSPNTEMSSNSSKWPTWLLIILVLVFVIIAVWWLVKNYQISTQDAEEFTPPTAEEQARALDSLTAKPGEETNPNAPGEEEIVEVLESLSATPANQ